MTLGASNPDSSGGQPTGSGNDKAALEGMLKSYPIDQLVEEVLIAWDELGRRNDEVVTIKQRLRVLELDLAEREDEVAPEIQRLHESEEQLRKPKHALFTLIDCWPILDTNSMSNPPRYRKSSKMRFMRKWSNCVI